MLMEESSRASIGGMTKSPLIYRSQFAQKDDIHGGGRNGPAD